MVHTFFNIAPHWEVTLGDQYNRPVALFDKYEGFTINKRVNDVGTFSITFKDDGDERYGKGYWLTDSVVTFIRDLPFFADDNGRGYFKSVEFHGLVRKKTKGISNNGERTITFEGVSPEHLLTRRVIAGLQGETRSDKSGYAGDIMCDYVIENCGEKATADYGRWFYADTSETPTRVDAPGVMPFFYVIYPRHDEEFPRYVGSHAFENLFDVIKQISDSARMDFTVEVIGEQYYLFEVWPEYGIGHNRSIGFDDEPVLFSVENETVADVEGVWDRTNEANYVFMLGSGDMSTRAVLPAYQTDVYASPYNQIESSRSVSVNPISDPILDLSGEPGEQLDGEFEQLKDAANAALNELCYKESIKFTPLQTPKCLYGEHYFLGDFVSVSFEHFNNQMRIVGVNISYESSGEERIEIEAEHKISVSMQEIPGRELPLWPPAVLAEYTQTIPPLTAPSSSQSPSSSVSRSVSPSLSPSGSASPSASASPSVPAASPSRSLSKSASRSPSRSLSISPSRSLSPSVSPSLSASKSLSASRSASPSQSRSISPSHSASPSLSASKSVSVSASPSRSPSPTLSPSRSLSPSASRSPSVSPSLSQSPSRSGSASASRSLSPSRSLSESASPSPSPSKSVSRSASRSVSRSASPSPSPSTATFSFAGTQQNTDSSGLDISFSFTPAGTPKGILVLIAQVDVSGAGIGEPEDDWVNGVTYGGTAMTRFTINQKATGEAGTVYGYFLGSSVPTGAQTVIVDIAGEPWLGYSVYTIAFTGPSDTVVEDYDISISSDSIANPSCGMSLSGNTCAGVIGFISGRASMAAITPLSGWSVVGEKAWGVVPGTLTTGCYTYDTISDVDFTAGWTQDADDAIAIAVAVREA